MIPYEGGKVYGPYLRKEDNRKHVIIIFPSGIRFTVSYPKYLMELKLGRYLKEDEEVHHKDDDFTNDSEDNLVILPSKIHKVLQTKNLSEVLICAYCAMPFIASSEYIRNRKANLKRGKSLTGPFCSKRCSGKVNH